MLSEIHNRFADMFRVLILCLCVCAAPAFAAWEGALKVRYELNLLAIGSTAFIDLPLSNSSAIRSAWVRTQRPAGPVDMDVLEMWCPHPDLSMCVLYDDTGFVAGLQIAFDVERYSDSIYDWKVQGYTSWTIQVNGVTKNYWATQMYFVTPAFLAIPAATRIANRNTYVLLQDRAIMVSGFNGEPYSISTRINDFTTGASDFTRQECIPWMGRHWYYKMTATTQCKADTMFPWFPLTYDHQLIGIGLLIPGKYATPAAPSRDWFERPESDAVKMVIAKGPQCLYDMPNSPGLITLHVYFIRHPYQLTCLFN